MNTQTKHEQEYMHIKKETLTKFLAKIHIYLGVLFLVFISFDCGKDYGYEKGFQEGQKQESARVFETIHNTSCNGLIDFTDMNNQTTTLKKVECENIYWGNPNGFLTGLGRMPSFDGTQLSIGVKK